jgi:hypothetical protein
VLRTADCPAKLAGPGAVRSTQFGAEGTVVVTAQTVLQMEYVFPPSYTSRGEMPRPVLFNPGRGGRPLRA